MIKETIYLGRNNAIDLLLKAEGMAQDLSSVTRMTLIERNAAFTVDSSTEPAAFDWHDTGTTGKVKLALGAAAIVAGTYVCDLIVYDPTNNNGINWGLLVLEVR
jgi:hypothetical protein